GNPSTTNEAVNALLLLGNNRQTTFSNKDYPTVTVGSKEINLEGINKAGGYIRQNWDMTSGWPFLNMNHVNIEHHGSNMLYGSLYLKSLASMDEVKAITNTPLKIRKEFYLKIIQGKMEVLTP